MVENGTQKKWASPTIARSRIEKNGIAQLYMARLRLEKFGLAQLWLD
jgi:hypothetical protein